jgi:hypothetical protein
VKIPSRYIYTHTQLRILFIRIASNSNDFEAWAKVMNCVQVDSKSTQELSEEFRLLFERMDEIAREERKDVASI